MHVVAFHAKLMPIIAALFYYTGRRAERRGQGGRLIESPQSKQPPERIRERERERNKQL